MPTKAATTAAAASASAPKPPVTVSTKDERPEDVAAPVHAEDDQGGVRSGTFSFSDGAKYEGEFTAHHGQVVRHGVGSYVSGPERYDGQWEGDEMHGSGVYHFATGARYEGTFEHNVFHGTGVYTWADGALYDGAWYVGRMHGDGRYVDKDGVEWRGRFVNGKYDNGRVFHTLR